MKFAGILILTLTLLAVGGPTLAHEETDWMTLNQPSAAHRKLDALEGKWKTTTKIWMAGPDAPPGLSEGTSTFEWILDGRFLEERTDSVLSFPGENGELTDVPYSGRGLLGYDNVRNMYVNTWVDSLSTYISYSKGQFSPDGKKLVLYGEMDEPARGVYGRMLRLETDFKTPDHHVFTMYDLNLGENYKVMEIVYERI
ncbi:MAG: DUF1579 domain-containing protein [Candidatus Eremiobacteraeota bacterium]|nr:DUF1579 domain-containing protein [Candidatus Eremiobacteraeota bacterium]